MIGEKTMKNRLDLHGVKHVDVFKIVDNFIGKHIIIQRCSIFGKNNTRFMDYLGHGHRHIQSCFRKKGSRGSFGRSDERIRYICPENI